MECVRKMDGKSTKKSYEVKSLSMEKGWKKGRKMYGKMVAKRRQKYGKSRKSEDALA